VAKEVSFGPFRSIDLDKSRPEKISVEDPGILWSNKHKTLHRQVRMKLLHSEQDTIYINATVEIVKHTERPSILGDLVFGSRIRDLRAARPSTEVARNCIAATIRSSDSTEPWHMIANENRFNSYGRFSRGVDTIGIFYAHGSERGNRGYGDERAGLLFVRDGERLAALQTSGKKYVWLRTDIDKGFQQALAGLIAAILAVK
jgi:hypothetical protein